MMSLGSNQGNSISESNSHIGKYQADPAKIGNSQQSPFFFLFIFYFLFR